jgi:acyl-CoA thioester hydrolase
MENYSKKLQIRWADIDQNRHLRHSVYYDFGAFVRISFLTEHGLSSAKMEALKIGPIIFREEAIFKREIKAEDTIIINVELVSSTADYSRWSLRHHFTKEDGTLAAILNLDGAWIDIEKRKLTVPGEIVQKAFENFPRSSEFGFTKNAALKK